MEPIGIGMAAILLLIQVSGILNVLGVKELTTNNPPYFRIDTSLFPICQQSYHHRIYPKGQNIIDGNKVVVK
mgnify:CR=1